MSGLFITLEGIDGCGKTTQAGLLVTWLRDMHYTVHLTREPGGTRLGERIRNLVLSPEFDTPPESELFLYLADRAVHTAEIVRPALDRGSIVVCERHADSTLAYQGYGRGLDIDLLRRLNAMATGGLVPHLTLVLDLDPAQARLDAARLDRLESEDEAFRARVAEGFRRLAQAEPDRVRLVDGTAAVHAVHAEVKALVEQLLEREQPPGGRSRGSP